MLCIFQNSQIDGRNSDKSRKNPQRSSLLGIELTRAHQLLTEERHFDHVGLNDTLNTEDNSKVGIMGIKLFNNLYQIY